MTEEDRALTATSLLVELALEDPWIPPRQGSTQAGGTHRNSGNNSTTGYGLVTGYEDYDQTWDQD